MKGARAEWPSAKEFVSALLEKPLESVVQQYIFQGTPYVFRNEPEALRTLREHLCNDRLLKLSQENIIVVGSGKTGFSLSPDNFPRPFSSSSDIDVLVVDESLFDQVWMTILKWHYPRRGSALGGTDGEWARTRRKELYWGWFIPDMIQFRGLSFPSALKPLRDVSTAWFNSFQSLSLYPVFADRNVSGRLYRTWEHALMYQVDGLRQIRDTVLLAE